MHFLEYETWRIKEGVKRADYDHIISEWFKFLVAHRSEMFAEWVSAKYYQKTDHNGNPTGVFVMIFEYESLEAHHAYKERRKNWDGPYEAYKKVDPYQEYFDLDTVTCEYMQPLMTDSWFDFSE